MNISDLPKRVTDTERREILRAAAVGLVTRTASGLAMVRNRIGSGRPPRRCDRTVRALLDEGLLRLDGDVYRPTEETT